MSRSGYRLVRVGKFMTGMLGLGEIFAELYQAGTKPDESAAEELVRKARDDNYIPASSEGEFAEALLREYRGYYQAQSAPSDQAKKRRPMWRGIPREQVPWHPSIFDDLCNRCGKCIQFCPEKVFAWTEDHAGVVIASPFDCQIGCNSCERICPCEAITFPPRSILEGLG